MTMTTEGSNRMPTLQEHARALGDPTRRSIFEYVASADQPADVAELTAQLGLTVEGQVTKDPRRAQCRLKLRAPSPQSAQ